MKLYEIFEDDDCIYLILEYMTGGKLFDRIVLKEHYSEKEAADTIRPIVDGIKYCHALGIIHRDIKVLSKIKISLRISCMLRMIHYRLSKYRTLDLHDSSTKELPALHAEHQDMLLLKYSKVEDMERKSTSGVLV